MFFGEVLLVSPSRQPQGTTIAGLVVFRGVTTHSDPTAAREDIRARFQERSSYGKPDLDGHLPQVEIDLTMKAPNESRRTLITQAV